MARLDRKTLIEKGIHYDKHDAEPATYVELSQKNAEVALVQEGLPDFDGIPLTPAMYSISPGHCTYKQERLTIIPSQRRLDEKSRRSVKKNFRIPSLPDCERGSPKRAQKYQEKYRIVYIPGGEI